MYVFFLEKDHRWLVWRYHYQQFCLSCDKLLFPNSFGKIKSLIFNSSFLKHFVKIQTGQLNTLVNKFMAVSRLCGIFFIGVISVDQMVKGIFDENEVRSKKQSPGDPSNKHFVNLI